MSRSRLLFRTLAPRKQRKGEGCCLSLSSPHIRLSLSLGLLSPPCLYLISFLSPSILERADGFQSVSLSRFLSRSVFHGCSLSDPQVCDSFRGLHQPPCYIGIVLTKNIGPWRAGRRDGIYREMVEICQPLQILLECCICVGRTALGLYT